MIDSLEKLAEQKVWQHKNLASKVKDWKEKGEKIVFTNGCFDILHVGHMSYLLKASSFGDKLIIGLNTDTSVKKLKGPERPINSEDNRALILSSLFFVDAVILFEEETPLQLIKQIMPDVLVKGGDYKIENIVGAKEVSDNGGQVMIVDFLNGYSSTALINKIAGK